MTRDREKQSNVNLWSDGNGKFKRFAMRHWLIKRFKEFKDLITLIFWTTALIGIIISIIAILYFIPVVLFSL